MDESINEAPEKTIVQGNHSTMLKTLANRVNECENQLKDYEKNLITTTNIKMRNNINSTGSVTVAGSNVKDDDGEEVQIFELIELLKDIEDGGSILQVQNEKLENAQRNLQHQMNILDKMVKLLKLEKGLGDGDTKENMPPLY